MSHRRHSVSSCLASTHCQGREVGSVELKKEGEKKEKTQGAVIHAWPVCEGNRLLGAKSD
eukprot:2629913-Rhodomonas_salina.2